MLPGRTPPASTHVPTAATAPAGLSEDQRTGSFRTGADNNRGRLVNRHTSVNLHRKHLPAPILTARKPTAPRGSSRSESLSGDCGLRAARLGRRAVRRRPALRGRTAVHERDPLQQLRREALLHPLGDPARWYGGSGIGLAQLDLEPPDGVVQWSPSASSSSLLVTGGSARDGGSSACTRPTPAGDARRAPPGRERSPRSPRWSPPRRRLHR